MEILLNLTLTTFEVNGLRAFWFNKVQHGKWPISVFNRSGNLMVPFSSLLNRNFKMR